MDSEWIEVVKQKKESHKFRQTKQILNEIKYVNEQFQNLRTYIVPDPKAERVDLFYFVMFPADGSLADKPIVGKMFFPNPYPENPPVIHLFTKTYRYNVDVFHQGEDSFSAYSSMCFDILNKKGYGAGIWESTFNLAAVFASLLQVIVSVKVKQQYGDSEIVELVSMEKMVQQHSEVDLIWKKYRKYFSKCPKIEHVVAKKVPVTQEIEFFPKNICLSYEKSRKIFSSSPFRLYDADFSVLIDLTDLKNLLHDNYKYNFVISFVISNSKRDMIGDTESTILIRNGVTGTAAKKTHSNATNWFYHGKPLVYYDKILITIARRQITMVVADSFEKKDVYIHGDTVLSYLTDAEMGKLANDDLYYFNLFVQTKNTIPDPDLEKLFIKVYTDKKFGYIHPSERYQFIESNPSEPASVPLAVQEYIPFRLNLKFFEQGRIILNKQVYKYLNDLINRHDCGLNETRPGEDVIEFDKFQVFCIKNLLSDWLKSLPSNERNPKEWNKLACQSKVMQNGTNPIDFWSSFKSSQKSEQLLVNYTFSGSDVSNVNFVGVDLGSSSSVIFKKLLVTDKLLHLLNNYKHVVQVAKFGLAHKNDFNSVDEFSEFARQYEPNELIVVKIIGVIFNENQLVFLVDNSCENVSKSFNVKAYPEKRCLFIEYGFKDFGIINKKISHKLKRFNKPIEEYACESDETMYIFEKAFICLGKLKLYSFSKNKSFHFNQREL